MRTRKHFQFLQIKALHVSVNRLPKPTATVDSPMVNLKSNKDPRIHL